MTRLEIAKIISSGDGIGWADGKTFFVPGVLPGEIITVTAAIPEKSYFRVTAYTLLRPSPSRRVPVCPLFGVCGGCSFLHIEYPVQCEIKKSIFAELWAKHRLPPTDVEFVGLPEYNLRTRSRTHIRGGKPGFVEKGTHNVVARERCPLLSDQLNRIILSDAQTHNDCVIQYEYSEVTGEWLPARLRIEKQVNHISFQVSKGSFFQSSEKGAGVLADFLCRIIDLASPATMMDMFCGVGLFSMFGLKKGVKVTGLEYASSCVEDFRYNCPSAALIVADADRFFEIPPVDLLIVDPPRRGLKKEVVESINSSELKNLVYVSCDPSTFVRDASFFCAAGFAARILQLVDLFPNTSHFEVCAFFTR